MLNVPVEECFKTGIDMHEFINCNFLPHAARAASVLYIDISLFGLQKIHAK